MNKIEKFVLGGTVLCIGSLVFIMNETKEVELVSTPLAPEVVEVAITEAPQEVLEATITPEIAEITPEEDIDTSTMVVSEWDNKKMLAKNGDISFREAFANARTQLGPGQTFEWYGERYTTDYFYELKTVVGEVVVVNNNKGNLELEQKESLADVEEIVTYRDNEEVKVSYEHLFPDAIAAAKKNGTYDDSKIMENN
jgi:hypothetical protein